MYIKKLIIFSTKFTENLALNIKNILTPFIECKVFIRKISKKDIINLQIHECFLIISPQGTIPRNLIKYLIYKNYFVYQTEQLNIYERKDKFFQSDMITTFNWSYNIFDYSKKNLSINNKKTSTYLPFALNVIDNKNYQKTIDIVFFGTLNKRREIILDTIKMLFPDLVIEIYENIFGIQLKDIIKKSKIVLNLHYYENSLLEVARLHEIIPYNTHIISEKTFEKDLINNYDFVYFIDEIKINYNKNNNVVFNLSNLQPIKLLVEELLASENYNIEIKKKFIKKNNDFIIDKILNNDLLINNIKYSTRKNLKLEKSYNSILVYNFKHYNKYYFSITEKNIDFSSFDIVILVISLDNRYLLDIENSFKKHSNVVILVNNKKDKIDYFCFGIIYNYIIDNKLNFKNITYLSSDIIPLINLNEFIKNNNNSSKEIIYFNNDSEVYTNFLQMNYDCFLTFSSNIKYFHYDKFFYGYYKYIRDILNYNKKNITEKSFNNSLCISKDIKHYFKFNENYDFGIIMLRHVSKKEHDKLWIECYDNIRKFYPNISIIIIDDGSNYNLISDKILTNVEIIQSEYPKRGELLPYLYLLKYKWFSKALIIHDSLFINSKLNITCNNYLQLWHFNHGNNQYDDECRLLKSLSNNEDILEFHKNKKWYGIFGGMTLIALNYLEKINVIHNLYNLVNVIHNRYNRMSLERILSVLFKYYDDEEKEFYSFFGDIEKYETYNINYTYYIENIKNKNSNPVNKVWSGR